MRGKKEDSIIQRFKSTLTTITEIVVLAGARMAHAQAPPPPPIFQNPLILRTPHEILRRIIFWLLGIVGTLALIALIIGGVRMIFGGFGDEQEAKKAKQIIFWAIAGLAVVIVAWIIVAYVAYLLGATADPGSL